MTRLAAIACAWAAVGSAACAGATGTVTVTLITAPGSHVLDAVERLQLTITDPHQVIDATRSAGGFDLALDLDATGVAGALIVEGFDAGGALVACGQSPAFPVSAITARIAVYMAAPRTFAASPVALDAARSDVSGATLSYGAVLAGGRDAGGASTTAIAIYNAYDHSLTAGLPLPGPRAGLAAAADATGLVLLFGGAGGDGGPTGTLWQFDTTAAPSGSYTTLSDEAGFARSDQLLVSIGGQYVVTGAPPLSFAAGSLSALGGVASLPAAGAAAVPSDGIAAAIFAGPAIVRFRQGAFDTLSATGRQDAAATTLPDGRVVIVGGGDPITGAATRDALLVDGATGAITTVADALSTARSQPSVAATTRYLVVAGGSDASGAPIATADVLDVATLAPIITVPILPRTQTFAAALPNDQVLIAGGTPASDQIELFTPDPPP